MYGLFTSSLGSRIVHSTKSLVPLIALSYDHQNHSKWYKWCHVRYTMMTIQHVMLLRDRSIGSDVACSDLSSFERAHLNWFSFPATEIFALRPKRIGNCVRPLSLWTLSIRNKASPLTAHMLCVCVFVGMCVCIMHGKDYSLKISSL